MKTVFTILGLLIASVSFSHAQDVKGAATMENVQLRDLKISVTVDSAQEVETVFDVKDIKKLLGEIEKNEDVYFEIICNGDPMSNGKKSSLTYKIEGSSNNIKDFLKRVKQVRKAAIKYYNNKE